MFTFSGFRDGHCHPLFAAREIEGPDVSGLHTPETISEALQGYLDTHPDADWLDCGSYSPDLASNERFTRETLDLASATVPIVVHLSLIHILTLPTKRIV